MKKLIVVADWASDSLSPAEFRSSVGGFIKSGQRPDMSFVASTSSTIHTAFLASQVVETEERLGIPGETVIFLNTDPRLPKNKDSINRDGGKLLIIKLKSGIFVAGPNAGFCFSMLKSKIDEVFFYDVAVEINQFRSRDLYARILAHLMEYMEKELELEEVRLSLIPDLTEFWVGHIDNFGNIKTTLTREHLKGKYELGELVEISINNINKKARYVENLFAGARSELVIYPGSSGHFSNPFLEISAWSNFAELTSGKSEMTGKDFFGSPKPGDKILML